MGRARVHVPILVIPDGRRLSPEGPAVGTKCHTETVVSLPIAITEPPDGLPVLRKRTRVRFGHNSFLLSPIWVD